MASASWRFLIAGSLLFGMLFSTMPPRALTADPAPESPSAGKDSAVLKRILAHWRAREDRIKSLHVTWRSQRTSLRARSPRSAEVRAELWLEGYTCFRVQIAPIPADRSRNGESSRTFDGSINRGLTHFRGSSNGGISKGSDGSQLHAATLSPLLLALLPFAHDAIDRSPNLFRVVSQNAVLDGKHCVKIERDQTQFVESFWVDPAREDIIVGWEQRPRNAPASLFATVKYQLEKDQGWIPTRWTQTDSQFVRSLSTESTMTTFAINEKFPPQTFTLAFPPGTAVVDETIYETYVVGKDGAKVDLLKFDSAGSLRVHQAFEQPVDFTIDPEPLKDALDFIATRYQIDIVIDPQAVKRGLIDPAVEVKVDDPGIKLKRVLELLLKQSPKPLGFEVRNGRMTVISAPRPR
jgi:hypothetical protein